MKCVTPLIFLSIFRNLLGYLLPITFITTATIMLLMKGLKEQGRLGRSFGKVTIRDQPPSNTIQKIIAVKEAIADLENRLQRLNVTFLKVRTIFLAGQPEVFLFKNFFFSGYVTAFTCSSTPLAQVSLASVF